MDNEQAPSALAALKFTLTDARYLRDAGPSGYIFCGCEMLANVAGPFAAWNWLQESGTTPEHPAWLTELVAILNAAPAQAAELVALRAEVERLKRAADINARPGTASRSASTAKGLLAVRLEDIG